MDSFSFSSSTANVCLNRCELSPLSSSVFNPASTSTAFIRRLHKSVIVPKLMEPWQKKYFPCFTGKRMRRSYTSGCSQVVTQLATHFLFFFFSILSRTIPFDSTRSILRRQVSLMRSPVCRITSKKTTSSSLDAVCCLSKIIVSGVKTMSSNCAGSHG